MKTRFLNKAFFSVLLLGLSLSLSACLSVNTGSKTAVDGGFWYSADAGQTWKQKNTVSSVSGKASIASLDNISLAVDPQDKQAFYYGSVENGLFYTYDGGESWSLNKNFGKSSVRAVAVDPKDKCTIYAAQDYRVRKSIDCGRSWEDKYVDDDRETRVRSLAIDYFDTKVIYVSLSRGDVLRSADGGENWSAVLRTKKEVVRLIVDPNDSRRVWALNERKTVWVSSNSGLEWKELSGFGAFVKEQKIESKLRDLVLIKGSDKVYVALEFGLVASDDLGETWRRIELIQPKKETTINALAVDPVNPERIYFVTDSTFYRTTDGGQSWKTVKMPSSRAGWRLMLDPEDASKIYMTVQAQKR